MIERIDAIAYDPERFVEHLGQICRALQAPFSGEATRRVLRLFDPEFRECVVQMKATSKAGTGVYYRFFYNGPRDLTARAQEAGMVNREPAPIVRLEEEVLAAFSGATRAGLDFESGSGLAKVWTYTGGPVPVDRVLALQAIPDAAREHAPLFARFGLEDVYFVCSDHQGQTMNIYFGWDPAHRDPEWIRRLVAATGGSQPSDPQIGEILRSQAVAGGVGMTFRWDAPELRRWCVYSLDVPHELPITLPDRLARFRSRAPTLNAQAQHNIAWSFGPAGIYIKFEKSYARDATLFLTTQMGGDLAHAALPAAGGL